MVRLIARFNLVRFALLAPSASECCCASPHHLLLQLMDVACQRLSLLLRCNESALPSVPRISAHTGWIKLARTRWRVRWGRPVFQQSGAPTVLPSTLAGDTASIS